MKQRFDRVIPETPESFHLALEAALAQTARSQTARHFRPAVVLAAALAMLLLAGSALAIGSHLGLWDFMNLHGRREVPSDVPPQTEAIDASAVSGNHTFTVLEAYREGRTVTILAQLTEDGADLSGLLPWESARIRTEDGVYLNVLDEQQVVNGASCHVLTCTLPENAPDETTLYVSMDWYAEGDIPVTVTRREGASFSGVSADHLTFEGCGVTFTDFILETTALNRTLTLRYTFDSAAIIPPQLPSQNLSYFTGGDGVFHTRADCPALNGTASKILLQAIVRESMTGCSEADCTFFAEEYEPLSDGIYLELLDADGNPLPCESLMEHGLIPQEPISRKVETPYGTLIEHTTADAAEGHVFETVFLLDGLPDTIQLRAYDCWTKARWADTITLTISE